MNRLWLVRSHPVLMLRNSSHLRWSVKPQKSAIFLDVGTILGSGHTESSAIILEFHDGRLNCRRKKARF